MKRPIDFVRWFMPGLGVKRWLVVAVFGAVLFVNGASRWLTDEGAHGGHQCGNRTAVTGKHQAREVAAVHQQHQGIA